MCVHFQSHKLTTHTHTLNGPCWNNVLIVIWLIDLYIDISILAYDLVHIENLRCIQIATHKHTYIQTNVHSNNRRFWKKLISHSSMKSKISASIVYWCFVFFWFCFWFYYLVIVVHFVALFKCINIFQKSKYDHKINWNVTWTWMKWLCQRFHENLIRNDNTQKCDVYSTLLCHLN